ncbi:MAG: divalent-cation tolerance protein CutA [Lysobacterales bacterium]|jgi:periplasmic divalent cation tolerance protein
MSDLQLVLTTAPDPLVAEAIARALVEAQLAACVSLLPGVTSVYRWQGEVETTREVQLLIKTRASTLPALMSEITRLHPYALPELVAIPIESGLPAYLDWVRFGSTPPVRSA